MANETDWRRSRGWRAGWLACWLLVWPAFVLAATTFELDVLSGRADSVTGGDALLRVRLPEGADPSRVRVAVNGREIGQGWVTDPAAHTLTGRVDGLALGRNVVTVRGARGAPAAFVLVNHPAQGPVFSGPRQEPFVCETQNFQLPAGLGTLGPSSPPDCAIARRVDYLYRTTAGALAAWPAGTAAYPADLVWTKTTLGHDAPYIVRLETGTVDRAIYQIALLHDPIAEPGPSWRQPPQAWNQRLVYTFGGGCFGGWYRQGASTGGVTDDFLLRSGYALASSSLNVFGNNCNDLLAAEAMMMVKERFIEAYGPPRHTQGFGCSGGSYAQHQIADNYPGLLDGILPGCSFPEVGFGTIHFITDAWLLDHYFNERSTLAWSDEQKRRVTGFGVYATAPNVAVGARRIDPDAHCGVLPPELAYDPVANPGGARCDVYDHTVNVYGRDPATGFARRPLDNVGIQYGLQTLNDGVISVDQFLDLNERIAGFDADANILPPGQRTRADLVATRAAYRSGRLTNGGGGLASIPIIDYRAYNDDVPNGDIHLRYHSFSMRARLEAANGRADNHVMLVEDNRYGLYSTQSPLLQRSVLALDRWISAIHDDGRELPAIDKVVQNKPADLQEGCMTRDAEPSFIAQQQTRDPATSCAALYPVHSFPREQAGAGIAADVIKCRRKAPDRADYAVAFSAAQWQRLRGIFRGGVCDWTQPGVQQQGLAGTWLSFDRVPGTP
ncbi:DUF6351 family protein [Rubrivivax gelatinosus]|uniref:DUF6351 domain-containing protein n=1 Tax=Rubrivivax gelatinosus TaxID=28068 RepID=A0A4V2SGQ8_RUBGE|nr:DUF6351 family protein [Rubrivivax gelatinosus]TCP02128.1 hypothetical protein EV684_107133 [Rubrivivax gelatinosus]